MTADVSPTPPGALRLALRRAQAAMNDDLAAQFAGAPLRPGQYTILALLGQAPGLRQSQLSAALGMQRTNLVPLLDALVRDGMIERRAVPGDRRAAGLHLTGAGQATLAHLAPLAAEHERRFTARLGPGGGLALLGLLARLCDPAFDSP